MRVLITGLGFVGKHIVEYFLQNTDWEIIIFTKHISKLNNKRISIFEIDLTNEIPDKVLNEVGEIDYIYHLAADTDIENSIVNPINSILTNVKITLNILEFARKIKPKIFFNCSSNECFGPSIDGIAFKERNYHYPPSPYSCGKSCQENIGITYYNTYKVNVVTIHLMNCIGDNQNPKKLIPTIIRKILNNEEVSLLANEDLTVASSRTYLHASNIAAALLHITKLGYYGYEEWNVGGDVELNNLKLAQMISSILGKPLKYKFVNVNSGRPGHDMQYLMDSSKLFNSGFKYPISIEDSIISIVNHFLENSQ